MKALLRSLVRPLGWDVVRYPPRPPGPTAPAISPLSDLSPEEQAIIDKARPYTMTSPERMAALIEAVRYVTSRSIPGDIAECGVWRGGSMMIVALALLARGDTHRTLYLYDTFEGMPPPSAADAAHTGESAAQLLENEPKNTGIWCYATLEDVRANLLSTGYPAEKIRFIKGKVEDTIPGTLPSAISLLRLDTDWYESTRHELQWLYPAVTADGVVIVDDYGHWQGARRAVDEFLGSMQRPPYLHRIDYTGRLFIKPA